MSRSTARELSSSSASAGLGDGLALRWGFGFRVSSLMSMSKVGESSSFSAAACLRVVQESSLSRISAGVLTF